MYHCCLDFDLRWQSQRQSFVVMLISVYLSIKYPGKSTNVFTAFYFMQMEAGMAKNRDRNGIKFLYIPHLTSCTSILCELGINLQDSWSLQKKKLFFRRKFTHNKLHCLVSVSFMGLQSKYSVRFAHYLGMIFINRDGLHHWNQNSIFGWKIKIFQQ